MRWHTWQHRESFRSAAGELGTHLNDLETSFDLWPSRLQEMSAKTDPHDTESTAMNRLQSLTAARPRKPTRNTTRTKIPPIIVERSATVDMVTRSEDGLCNRVGLSVLTVNLLRFN